MSEPFKFTDQQRAYLSQDLETWEKQSMGFDWLVKAIEDNINYGIESIISARDVADQDGTELAPEFVELLELAQHMQSLYRNSRYGLSDEIMTTIVAHLDDLRRIPSPPKSEK